MSSSQNISSSTNVGDNSTASVLRDDRTSTSSHIHQSEQDRLAAAGLDQNPLGPGHGTHSTGGHTTTNVYRSNEQPVSNPGPVHIQHHDGPSGIDLSNLPPAQPVHHHTEHRHTAPAPTPAPAPPPQPQHHERREPVVGNSDNILDTSERPRDTDADDHREFRGEGTTEYTNNNEEAGGLRPHGTKPTQQTGKDTFENQAGSAHASTHKPVDPRDVDVSIGSKGDEYAGTTSSSNMAPTSVGGGEGTGTNHQTNDHTTGGMGKRDGEGAMGGGGGIVGKLAEKMGLGKGNTHTADDGARAVNHAEGADYHSKASHSK